MSNSEDYIKRLGIQPSGKGEYLCTDMAGNSVFCLKKLLDNFLIMITKDKAKGLSQSDN